MTEQYYYWIGFLLYAFIVIGIGIFAWLKEKRSGSETDNAAYWEASRSLSFGSVGLSISASMMSISWSCVYGVQLFYWYGWGGAWLLIIPWLVTMAGFYLAASKFRSLDVFSQPHLLEKRFGTRTRQMLAPALIIVFITWTGAEIYAAGQIISPFLGISLNWTLFLISAIVAIYTYSGGFSAVVSTDKIQFFLVAFFITVIAVLGWNALPTDSSLFQIPTPPKAKPGLLFFTPGIALILITFIAYLPGWLIETDVWLRLQGAKDNRAAKRGVLIAGFNSFVFVGVMPLIIGLAALILYPPVNGAVPAQLQDGTLIFTVLMKQYAPLGLSIFLSVGLIAAAMSTIDTNGNVTALSFSHDLMEPLLQKSWTPKQLNTFARWSSVGAVLLAFIYAVFTESLWDIFYLSSGILTTTVFLPVIGSFFKSTKPLQVQLAIVFGLVSTLVFYFMESRGMLSGVQPEAVSQTGLGYILWGFAFSAAGFFGGRYGKNV